MSEKVKRANKYIQENIHKRIDKYRHSFHAMSQYGWANDPNGLLYHNNLYHIFYQHNPYSNSWGPMHWGHLVSHDLIKWINQPIVLAPDAKEDELYGCFSGTSIAIANDIYLIYTATNEKQQQGLAYSRDNGLTFTKYQDNPIITSKELPNEISKEDFRDPTIFKRGNKYYFIAGTKINNYGQLVLFVSSDLFKWSYIGPVLKNTQLNGVYECPSFVTLDNYDLLITSPQFYPKQNNDFENIHSVAYAIGNLDLESGKFTYDKLYEVDGGFDFYAAQVFQANNKTILIAWMNMWDRTYPTQSDNWVGSFTIPRELSIKEKHLYQEPTSEIFKYLQNKITYQNILLTNKSLELPSVKGNVIYLDILIETTLNSQFTISLLKEKEQETNIIYQNSTIVFNRKNSGLKISGKEDNTHTRTTDVFLINNTIRLQIFIDISSVEVFINSGYSVMTSLVYPTLQESMIVFQGIGYNKIISLNKYDIVVDKEEV